MKDENKTKKQLIQELTELRKENDEFSAAKDQWMKTERAQLRLANNSSTRLKEIKSIAPDWEGLDSS